ncbi:double-strand break repair helicase AddA [Tabrizicola caldifontis]|uniref:double-strand break repair helicase AddA n=1 Tax=Tabrizicola caldifontis TaxID=2528036 RepID=UPI00107FE375|nr:double-strand break repair helicase AddA [Rhodobacter sp. YIM 73028]
MTITPAGLAQIDAAHPARNTWLSANAGSGKTRVLTDRVARLLLGGVEPQHILCLTYTKAAASEMQNRLFKRLGEWAMKPDEDLRRALLDLGETELDAPRLARARQLFARAIETPGGLRIQTIHSFCASLLRRFPLEAGVPPGFTEMDDRLARLMRAQIVEDLADRLAPEAVRKVTRLHTGEDFTALVEQIARYRDSFDPQIDRAAIWKLFGLPPGFGVPDLLQGVFAGDEAAWLPDLISGLAAGSVSDVKAAERLGAIDLARPGPEVLAMLEGVLLFGDGTRDPAKRFTAKVGDFPTKATRNRLADLMPALEALMLRVEAARERRLALAAAEKTAALHGLALPFLAEYDRRKADGGHLDFDDLIRRARRLLKDPSLAAWVLYRLDGGIDHVLVDEAQDTSPEQWDLIQALTSEMTAGEGAGNRPRTLFVVGDKKQSIYSFQGADVAAFDHKRDHFADFLAGGNALVMRSLEYSFRSSPAILQVVDRTFTPAQQAALGGESRHKAFHETLPGRVDVWPPVEPTGAEPEGDWHDPVDQPSPESPVVVLARRIAEWMRDRVERGEQIPQAGNDKPPERPIRYGDFLILVQRRSPLFHEIIRACKALGLPIAGADRLKLGGELAVKDLAALLAFLDTPEDDLSLAAVLRSPLCGWSEADLFRLAHPRKGFLWEALRDDPAHHATLAFLNDLRDQADFLRPYDLLERVLYRHDGRRKLLDRLGPEAEDGIDELLGQALAYEANEVPSLTGFLVWMQTDDVEVKRQLDSEGDRIRVMTVHGAKGLEAEIVILPDTGDRKPQERDELYRLPDGPAVWKAPQAESPALIAAERSARKAREAEERLRLLYVAMTRARCWLVAAVAGEVRQEDSWYSLIRDGVERAIATDAGEGIRRHAFGDWPLPVRKAEPRVEEQTLPDWLARPAPPAPAGPPVLSPSDLGGAKALPGEAALDSEEAKRRGTALHLLLERLPCLPRADWPAHAAGLIGPDLAAALLAEARTVLDHPDLSPLFSPDTLAEVAVSGDWNGARLVGTIDRLIVAPDRVRVIDYKSNALIPDHPDLVPEGILRQLGAYAHLLAQVYPDRPIETAILWTRAPRLMPLDPGIVSAALARATIP